MNQNPGGTQTPQKSWPKNKTALLLDMNSTFMFGEDRFSEAEDFSLHYSRLGGTLPRLELEAIIRNAYDYLDSRYPDEQYRHNFPSLTAAITSVVNHAISDNEMHRIVDTFAFHELGHIPAPFKETLFQLKQNFTLAVVIDVWSPKTAWLNYFDELEITSLFSASSFSSDHGMVKPSPRPFQIVLNQLGILPSEALVIGDSARRDLGGANAAGIDCILVGGAEHPDAIAHCVDLVAFSRDISQD